MKASDRRCEIDKVNEDMYYSFDSLVASMHRLEENERRGLEWLGENILRLCASTGSAGK